MGGSRNGYIAVYIMASKLRGTLSIQREKSLKRYNRDWKLNPIDRENPEWIALYRVITGQIVSKGPLTDLPRL